MRHSLPGFALLRLHAFPHTPTDWGSEQPWGLPLGVQVERVGADWQAECRGLPWGLLFSRGAACRVEDQYPPHLPQLSTAFHRPHQHSPAAPAKPCEALLPLRACVSFVFLDMVKSSLSLQARFAIHLLPTPENKLFTGRSSTHPRQPHSLQPSLKHFVSLPSYFPSLSFNSITFLFITVVFFCLVSPSCPRPLIPVNIL